MLVLGDSHQQVQLLAKFWFFVDDVGMARTGAKTPVEQAPVASKGSEPGRGARFSDCRALCEDGEVTVG